MADDSAAAAAAAEGRLFHPYRALGVVCGEVPPVLHQLGAVSFLAVAIDKSFLVYDGANLSTRMVSPPLRRRIRSVHCVLMPLHAFATPHC